MESLSLHEIIYNLFNSVNGKWYFTTIFEWCGKWIVSISDLVKGYYNAPVSISTFIWIFGVYAVAGLIKKVYDVWKIRYHSKIHDKPITIITVWDNANKFSIATDLCLIPMTNRVNSYVKSQEKLVLTRAFDASLTPMSNVSDNIMLIGTIPDTTTKTITTLCSDNDLVRFVQSYRPDDIITEDDAKTLIPITAYPVNIRTLSSQSAIIYNLVKFGKATSVVSLINDDDHMSKVGYISSADFSNTTISISFWTCVALLIGKCGMSYLA